MLGTLNTGVDPNGNLRGTAGVIDITDVRSVNTATNPGVRPRCCAPSTPAASAASWSKDQSGYISSAGAPTYYAPLATISTPGGLSSSSGYVDTTRASQYDPAAGLRYNYTTATDNDQQIDISVSNEFGVRRQRFHILDQHLVRRAERPTRRARRDCSNGSYLTAAGERITYTGT